MLLNVVDRLFRMVTPEDGRGGHGTYFILAVHEVPSRRRAPGHHPDRHAI